MINVGQLVFRFDGVVVHAGMVYVPIIIVGYMVLFPGWCGLVRLWWMHQKLAYG